MPSTRLPWGIVEWGPDGTQMKGKRKEKWMDGVRRRMSNREVTEEESTYTGVCRKLIQFQG
jgi:hypothetical protein